MAASTTDLRRLPLFLRKKLTVIGIIGHTQGVSSASRPPPKPQMKITHQGESLTLVSVTSPVSGKVTGAHQSAFSVGLSATGCAGATAATVSAVSS